MSAMTVLANGLGHMGRHDEKLVVLEAELAIEKQYHCHEENIVHTRTNMGVCLSCLDRDEEALILRREVYAKSLELGLEDHMISITALNLSVSLRKTGRYTEMKSFLRKQLPRARRAAGAESEIYLDFRRNYAVCLYSADGASRNDVVEAAKILAEVASTARRVFGTPHPFPSGTQHFLARAQEKLAAFDTSK